MFERVQSAAPPPTAETAPIAERRAALTKLIINSVAAMTALRLATWLPSLLLVGPILGTVMLALITDYGTSAPVIAEALLTIVFLGVVALILVKTHTVGGGWLRGAQALGWVTAVEIVGYLASIVIALTLHSGDWSLVRQNLYLIVPVTLLNLPLIWLSTRIIRGCRDLRRW